MIRKIFLRLLTETLIFSALAASAQTFLPKTIHFKGDSEYSDADLTAAAGLKAGEAMTQEQINEHLKILLDSGLFDNITFTFNADTLVIQLLPSKSLHPLRLENLPLTGGSELQTRLRTQVPLYRGKVPEEGTLLDQVRRELESQLAAQGIEANLTATPYTELGKSDVSAVNISVTSPTIDVGEIELQGVSPALLPKANQLMAKLVATTYSYAGSPNQIETNLSTFYKEQGYLEVSIQVTAKPTPLRDQDGVHILFLVTVGEGFIYKLSGVTLAPDLLVSQSDFNKAAVVHPGDVASLEKLRGDWLYIARQYHNKGYIKAVILATPLYDKVRGTVHYMITAKPGPVYGMGTLTVESVPDDIRTAILTAWPVPQGAPFNEGAIMAMTETHDVNPVLERLFKTMNLRYTLDIHDDAKTVDLTLRLERNH